MSGPKRNPDKLNTIGIVVVGLCGAVLVYVTIVALEAFYVNDTAEVQTTADYGGQEIGAKSLRADQLSRVNEYASNPKPAAPKPNEPPRPQSYRIPVDVAMKLVAEEAKTDPSNLIPTLGKSDKGTVLPIFGRPRALPLPATPGAAPAGATPAPGAGSAAGSGAPAAGAAPAVSSPSAPMVPTGAGTGPSPVGGAGPLDKPSPTPPVPPGSHPSVTPAGSAGWAAPAPAGSAAPKAGSGAGSAKGNGK
jgi:hypothetical protein